MGQYQCSNNSKYSSSKISSQQGWDQIKIIKWDLEFDKL